MWRRPLVLAVCTVSLAAVGAAALLERCAPMPAADVARGSEGAFADGLYPRELPPRSKPIRWISGRAFVRFRDLAPGPATLDVALHSHSGPVTVAVGGVIVGALEPGATQACFPVRVDGSLDVELRPQILQPSGGRRLGAQLDRVGLETGRRSAPSPALVLTLLVPAVAVVLTFALVAGGPPLAGACLGLLCLLIEAGLLWPSGLLYSPYALTLATQLTVAALVAGVFALVTRRPWPTAPPWAFAAVLVAILVQGVLATSPIMAVSDVLFHANKLSAVSAGDLFPTSRTQHAHPFVIPYGVSFYALLAPLHRAGVSPIALVQWGAGIASIAASAALFAVLAGRGARFAFLAVLMLQLLPGTFDIYSFGNLSNVFAQAVTVGFFAWWCADTPGNWPLGAALLALGCVAHLSGFIVLGALVVALMVLRGPAIRSDRVRLMAVFVGFGLGIAYYSHFLPLILESVARLREGGGQGRGASRGAGGALLFQLLGAQQLWGLPAVLLAAMGWPRPGKGAFERDLLAFWIGGALLAVPAVLSPLDVRYLYALTLPLAVGAAAGLERLGRFGPMGTALAVVLLGSQGALAVHGIVYDLLFRYRA
jgi:hypothetical protein